MLLHEFRPARLIAGAAATAAAALFLGDATGAWQTPWFVALVIVFDGLFLAGAVAFVHYRIRRRRSARAASTENTDAPASTSGSQAIR
ncbi:hypothetical protein ACWCXB_17565 [Streptomyces sp. NPDC001514]